VFLKSYIGIVTNPVQRRFLYQTGCWIVLYFNYVTGVWKYGNVLLFSGQVIWKKLLVRTKSCLSCFFNIRYLEAQLWVSVWNKNQLAGVLSLTCLTCVPKVIYRYCHQSGHIKKWSSTSPDIRPCYSSYKLSDKLQRKNGHTTMLN
jgi:hypothetical protein